MITIRNQFPKKDTQMLISGPAGELEIAVEMPKINARAIMAVICHPHPQMGGTMHNKVVTTTARAYRELGVTTVRFNFRGVGQSTGSFADGVGEKADLLAVVDWVRQHNPQYPLWLAGFSFGSFIALSAAHELPAKLLVAIAPPVHYPQFQTIIAPKSPWFIVQGEQDDVVNSAQVFAWAEQQQPAPTLIKMPEAGHFFHGHLIQLKDILIKQLRSYL